MRDRLIELVKSSLFRHIDKSCKLAENIADDLLSEGVIVPPCKVGQTAYCIRYDKARKPFVKPIGVLSITSFGKGRFTVFANKEDTWGITAFATAEEAEKALAERSENGK